VTLHQFAVESTGQSELQVWMDGPPAQPVTPRPAATVLLLREAVGDLEVLLLRRRTSMAFAAGMHVFPGGGVDPRDSEPGVPWVGPTPAEWGVLLDCPLELAEALVCAAVRELFEECGVLLAGPDPVSVVPDVSAQDWEQDRQALLDRSLPMSQLLIRRGLHLRSDLLRPWAHWTTPVFEPRRFDTWFFVARLPEGQVARDIGEEADRTHWLGVGEALAGQARDRLPMMPPTVVNLQDVARAAGGSPASERVGSPLDRVMASDRVVRRVMPWLDRREDGALVMSIDLDGRGGGASPVIERPA
jgi:8-oxo-dGTP pyrophosphatase MutT (NUDIX family)